MGNASSQSVNYSIGYGVRTLFDQSRAAASGSTIPVKLQLTDAGGINLSAAGTLVTAIEVRLLSTYAPGELNDAGQSNPDNNFRYDAGLGGASGGAYIFNLSTRGLATGTYVLIFRAGADPTLHTVQFQVR